MKNSITLGVLAVTFLSQTSIAKEPIIFACEQTIQNYAIYRDALDAEAYAEIFSEDGKFLTPAATYTGREELRDYINNKPDDIQTLHHITTKQITSIDNNEAKGVVYAQVRFFKISEGASTVYRQADAVYKDLYKLKNGKCEIQHRSLQILTDTQY